jgi:predicted TIM-barrel fold metal-dependent hydrolase
MIIDAHTHLFPPGMDKVGSAEMLLREMDACSVEKAIILGIYPRVSNEFIGQQATAHPDRFLGFASVDPNEGEDALTLLDRCAGEFDVKGLKLHPTMQSFNADDIPLLEPLIYKAAGLRLPILFHSWGWLGQQGEAAPLRLMKLAETFPQANFILAHTGGMRFMDLLSLSRSRKMGKLDNLYVDLSIILFDLADSPFWPFLVWTLEQIGLDRVMMGSDFPDYALQETMRLTERLGFNQPGRNLVMGGSAARLVGV